MSCLSRFRTLLTIRNVRLGHLEYQNIRSMKVVNFSSKETKVTKEEDDEPLSYLNSDAAKWTAKSSRTLGTENHPWFQPYVLSFSLGSLLIYYCILREENDIDQELSKNLYTRIPGLEQQQLELNRKYNLEHNLDVKQIDERLNQLKY